MQTIRTTCPYCGVGCGVLASVDDAGQVSVRGDDQHPANLGRLCVKGAALGETTGLAGRLLAPEVDGQQVALAAGAGGDRCASATGYRPARPAGGGLLRLWPAVNRGLLCRQQADEGIYRRGEHRHQFAAVHVVGGDRLQTGLWRRCGAL